MVLRHGGTFVLLLLLLLPLPLLLIIYHYVQYKEFTATYFSREQKGVVGNDDNIVESGE